jgi:hypothetical protein
MSLDAQVKAAAKTRELKTLVIDVERVKGKFLWPGEDRYDGLTIAGEFWSLSDYRKKFGRIPHQYVTEWPRTFMAAWRWIGEQRIHSAHEWDDSPATFAQTVRDQLDIADIATGHYAKSADRKWLNSLFRDHGINWPSPVVWVDTCTIARRDLGDESMTLDALCRRFGIPTKTGKYDAAVARAATEGDKRAQREVITYCKGDVDASTGLYFHTLPLAHGHPHVAPTRGLISLTCPRCSSSDVHRAGTWSSGVYHYAMYRCDGCPKTSYFKEMYEKRGPSVRAL